MINLVVSCSKRKRFNNNAAPSIRQIKNLAPEDRFSEWIDILQSCMDPPQLAESVYIGDHWSVARGLVANCNQTGKNLQLWVCSAGYGLISSRCKIIPYNATFLRRCDVSVSQDDSYEDFTKSNQFWWNRLSKWEGPALGQPRSIAELARTFPKCPLMVVGSRDYMEALYPDLQETLKNLIDPSLLIIISTELRNLAGLNSNIIPCDSRMQPLLGGALVSINIRMAKRIIEENEYDYLKAHILVQKYKHLLNLLPPLSTPKRIISDNYTVTEFIVESLRLNPNCTHSALLKRYRETGFACEQSRFRKLFLEVKEAQLDIF